MLELYISFSKEQFYIFAFASSLKSKQSLNKRKTWLAAKIHLLFIKCSLHWRKGNAIKWYHVKEKAALTIVFLPHPQAEHEAGEIQEGGECGAAAGWGQ